MRNSMGIIIVVLLISTFSVIMESEAQPVIDDEKPDLAVLGISFVDPDVNNLIEGERAFISILIENLGQNWTGTGWTITVYDNGRVIEVKVMMRDLGPGDRVFHDFDFMPKAGEREIRVVLDSKDIVDESVEENNEMEVMVEVGEAKPIVQWWVVCIPIVCVPLFFLGLILVIILIIWRVIKSKN
jgi:subtilase family serine protease